MEHDYGAVAGIAPHIGQHLFGFQLLAVVACHKVIHYYVVVIFDGTCLFPPQQPVRGAEKSAPYEVVGLGYVVHVAVGCHLHPLQVVHCVVAVAVSAAAHLFEQFRVACHIVADHEECGFDAVAVEKVEHPRGYLGYRPVVESKEHHLFLMLLYPPYGLWKKEAVEERGLFYPHAVPVLFVGDEIFQVGDIDVAFMHFFRERIGVATFVGKCLQHDVDIGRHISVGRGERLETACGERTAQLHEIGYVGPVA